MLDSNILIGTWAGKAVARALLDRALQQWTLIISPIVHTELFAHPGMKESDISTFLGETGIAIASIQNDVFTLAGRRFAGLAERRRTHPAGGPRRVAADFILGAHAVMLSSALVTLDGKFFELNFPELRLFADLP